MREGRNQRTDSGQRRLTWLLIPVVALLLVSLLTRLSITSASAQAPATIKDQLPTEQRLLQKGWWPTKRDVSSNEFVGPGQCADCHRNIFKTQTATAMALTMPPATALLNSGRPVDYSNAPYSYQLKQTDRGVDFSVSDTTNKISDPVGWVFGSGRTGKSFLFTHNGSYYEGRISHLSLLDRFDITPGQSTQQPRSLEKALGHRLGDQEARRCFACHATSAVTNSGLDTTHMIAGVTCEACHGPGLTHLFAMREQPELETMILNPAHFTPVDSVDFCGACHRTWWDTVESGFSGQGTVRFPAYRLVRSRCWGTGDRRLTCVACHDPHREVVHEASFYDSRCLACHVNGRNAKPSADHPGAACPKGTQQCITCHMPKYELPGMHLMFTEHQIRIVHPGEKFPG